VSTDFDLGGGSIMREVIGQVTFKLRGVVIIGLF
jgi:hypothetical protein